MPEKTKRALQYLHSQGVHIYLSSGRSRHMIQEHYYPEFMDGYSCADGSYIEIHGKMVEETPITKEPLQKLIDLAKRTNVGVTLQAYDCNYMNEQSKRHFEQTFLKFFPKDAKSFLERFDVRPLEEFDFEKIYKVDAHFLPDSDPTTFKDNLPEELYMIGMLSTESNETTGGEITMKEASKGNGIQSILKATGEKLEDSYGFGDSMNDRSMLKACGHGIAMGNADEKLKEVAEYVTTDVDSFGIIHALKHYGILPHSFE